MIRNLLAASITALALAHVPTGQAQQRPDTLPPPYDPIPGPFFIMLDAVGDMMPDQASMIDQVWSGWRGPKLEVFVICYSPAAKSGFDWKIANRAIESVSAALKARGATVVTAARWECDDEGRYTYTDRSHVKIVGVVRT